MINFNLYKRVLNIFNSKKNISFEQPCLTFIGVGPGDPSLLTIAAVDAIKKASLIAYPISEPGAKSIARQIVSKLIKRKKSLPIVFPMISDPCKLKEAWRKASQSLLEAVLNGEKVVLLCQGDPSLYATSSYIILNFKLNYSFCPIKVIPGITSFTAAAAIAKQPLSLQKEGLLVIPTPDNPMDLVHILDDINHTKKVLVLIKLGKRWSWVREILKDKNLLEATLFAKKIGFADEQICKASDIDATTAPYFTLLIVRGSVEN